MTATRVALPARHAVSAPVPLIAGFVAVTGYFGYTAWAMQDGSYDLFAGLVLFPVLVLVSVPLLLRAARNFDDPQMAGVLVTALALKLVAGFARYWVNIVFYDGLYDSETYHDKGVGILEAFRAGQLSWWDLLPTHAGTPFPGDVIGLLYSVMGPSRMGGFLVFSWLGFWGLFFFYKAAVLAVPDLDQRRYALLVFFLPSLVFWPSSVGKEALMMCFLGVAAYGLAKIVTYRRGGFLLCSLGLVGTGMVRPHVTLIFVAAASLAYLLRRNPTGLTAFGPLGKVVGLAVVAAGLVVAITQVNRFFGTEGVSLGEAVSSNLDRATYQSTQGGGSTIEAKRVENPLDFPAAAFSVLFRPMLFEARNVTSMAAAVEGTVLLGLVVASHRRLRQVPRLLLRNAYVVFVVIYGAGFIFAFSAIANLGLLSRQRVQVFPFLLVLLALPVAEQAAQGRRQRKAEAEKAAHARRQRLLLGAQAVPPCDPVR